MRVGSEKEAFDVFIRSANKKVKEVESAYTSALPAGYAPEMTRSTPRCTLAGVCMGGDHDVTKEFAWRDDISPF